MKSTGVDLSRIPYPARVLPFKNAREYSTFLDMFKQLKVNLQFIEVLQHMPKYDKFLKDLLSNKKKIGGISEVSLSEQCSAVVQNKLPEKLGDSGRFTIPCLFGGFPYTTLKYPRGIVENLLVKVGKFVFPVDFVILDMEVDDRVPLILGRPFLRTAKAMIDVFDGKLTLLVGDEMIAFDTAKSERDVGKHSHSVCMLEAFTDNHWDYDLEIEVGETAPNIEEPSDWVVELEKLLEQPDDYDDEVPDDLLEMMADFEEIIGKTPSVGKLVEVVEDPGDPGEDLEVPHVENPIPEPLPITIVLSEGIIVDPTPSSSVPRSRPPQKRTRALIDSSDLERVKTPSVGMFRGDNLLGYLNQVIFGPGRFKLWWKDLIDKYDGVLMFVGGICLMMCWRTGRPRRMKAVPVRIKEKPPDRLGFMLDFMRKIIRNEVPEEEVPSRYARDKGVGRLKIHSHAVREEWTGFLRGLGRAVASKCPSLYEKTGDQEPLGTRGNPEVATTILFLAVREEPNPKLSRSDLVFNFNSLR
ncbi:hypothetical protein L1987_19762 [Smallanthus sonchifolius]|uniref:Uncharacterized protein n=1 Tax=Smallanthus sonchifolius TaxID=185202 RepID=A0ACB9IQQ2_9ASTR|nr:hypothetical protein L1987_19762 [Smallanthus sonchifolius]